MPVNIKVYIFAYLFPPEYTGASIQAITLAKALRKHGVQVTFIPATPADENHDIKHHEGFAVIRLAPAKSSSNVSIISFWYKTIWILCTHVRRYDIIHVIGPCTLHNIIPWVGKLLRKPTLVKTTLSNELGQFHLPKKCGFEQKFNFYSNKAYNRIICISKMIMKELTCALGSGKRLEYIPNGVNTELFLPVNTDKKKELRKNMGLPADGLFFSYVGVLDKRKNLEWLVKNWLAAADKFTDVYLIIAGPQARKNIMADGGGPEFAGYLKDYVGQLGGENKVFFLPFRQDVEVYFQLTDFFMNPSLSEGLSNSMLEAMACGAVPIVSKTSGVEDVIDDEKNGFIFGINSNNDFKRVVKECYFRQKSYELLSTAATKKIKQQFSLETVCERYIKMYNELLHFPDKPQQ